MHPILFRIPLPSTPLKLWWGLAVVIAIALVYALVGLKKKDKATAAAGLKMIRWHVRSLPDEASIRGAVLPPAATQPAVPV